MTAKKNTKQLLTITILLLTLSLTTPNSLIQQAKAQKTHNITIQDFAFHPQNLTIITKGDTIVWTNNDSVIYTLWFVHEENSSTYLLSDPIPPQQTWSYMFSDSGKLKYYCFERLWITGHLLVFKILGDIDDDGDVDFDDFILFAGDYGTEVGEALYDVRSDLDGDGDVDFDDFIIFAGKYGMKDP